MRATFAALLFAAAGLQAAGSGQLAWFDSAARARIDAGAAVVDVLPASQDDFAAAGAVRTIAGPEQLVAWSRRIEDLQRGRYVPLIQRFSREPRIEDLSSLVLDEQDLEDLKDCRPARCEMKLSAAEIHRVQQEIAAAGRQWPSAAQEAFRRVLLDRAKAYAARGYRGMALYEDQKRPEDPVEDFEVLLGRFRQDTLFTPRLARHLKSYPRCDEQTESFLYWSKDLLGDAKAIISITHLSILHGAAAEPTIVAATQVYASHYLKASLSLTSVVDESDGRYLVYLRRSRADVFEKTFGGLIRSMVKRRVKSEGPPVLDTFRSNLERGIRGTRP